MNNERTILDTIGETPLLGPYSHNLFLKVEGFNPCTMKDRPALNIIEEAEKKGILRPGIPVIDATSGSFGEGLARVCCVKGYDLTLVVDINMDELTRAYLRALGAKLVIISKKPQSGGWHYARRQCVKQIIEENYAFWPNQLDNPDNPKAYGKTLAKELLLQTGEEIDILVGATGSGGSLTGTAKSLKFHKPDLRVIAVDSVGSVLFNQQDENRHMTGMGMSIIPKNLNRSVIDEVHWVKDSEAFIMARRLARETAILAGGSSGAVYLVAKWIAYSNPTETVVAILPDRGERYLQTIFNDDWINEMGIEMDEPISPPIRIWNPSTEQATKWSYHTFEQSSSHISLFDATAPDKQARAI